MVWFDEYLYIFTLNVIKKPDLITTGVPLDATTRLPFPYSVVISSLSSCPWGMDYSKTLYINGT